MLLTFCLPTVDQANLTGVAFLMYLLTKPFERTEKFSERLTKPFERIEKFSEWLTKAFERIEKCSERLTKAFERIDDFSERFSQAVRTNANYFQTASFLNYETLRSSCDAKSRKFGRTFKSQ